MSHFTGKKIAGVFLSSVGLLAGSIGYAATLQDQMRVVVDAAWVQGGAHSAEVPSPVLDGTVALYSAQDNSEGVEFIFSAIPEYNAFTLDSGARLVINFKNTVTLLDEAILKSIDPSKLKSVSAFLSSVEPEIASRLVIEFAEPSGFYEVEENGVTSFLIQSKSDMLTSKMTGMLNQNQGFSISLKVAAPAVSKLQLSKESGIKLENMESQLKNMIAKEFKPTERLPVEVGAIKSVGKARIDFLDFDNAAFDAVEVSEDDKSFINAGENDEKSFEPVEPAPVEEEEPAQEEELTEGEAVEEAAPEEAPLPRIEIAPVTSGANADFSSKMNEIQNSEEVDTTSVVVLSDGSAMAVEAKASIAMDTSKPRFIGDPLEQLVNVDFREMELSNVVALLSHKAGINVIAGTDLVGVVTANLRNVTLRRAMEEALRMNGLGLIEDGGIYRIVSMQEKMMEDRVTSHFEVKNGIAKDIAKILSDIIKGSLEAPYINIAFNDQKNLIVISGPASRVAELESLAAELDTAEPKMQTVTQIFKLNYADPEEVGKVLQDQLSEQGKLGVDVRARQVIVSDEPLKVEHFAELISGMDVSLKQVVIETLIVDITLKDDAQTGVSWILDAVRSQNQAGDTIGSLQELGLGTNLGLTNAASALNFGVLTKNIDWSGVVQAEVVSGNGRLYSNPVVVTVENKPARITIADEIPYIEFKQTSQGGQATNTEFKEIGTVLEVTPRVTHSNDIINQVYVKESALRGELNGIPIEAKREQETELRTTNGQTIFMGGLRKNNHDTTVRKVPILGDIPGVNVLFRNNTRTESINELMVFMTNTILEEKLPELNDYEKSKVLNADNAPMTVNAQNSLIHDAIYPSEMRDPSWKFRRSE